ncbi:glycoside hydrolase family 2 [Colletotrichum sp. SAR 10_86]|nr:glycoside hydrolase family 2 [Colletotrichum sp. SAR 10_75]KAI8224189.1 glycoside hydrolase family 2 [Colletotrichum sp. SAR 10_86]
MKEPTRKLRYNVATSVDGFIAPPDGSTDWIVMDSNIDFDALYAQFDAFLMGRKTYECMFAMGEQNPLRKQPKENLIVFSRTLKAEDHPSVTVVSKHVIGHVAELKNGEGRDIWLMGGGELAGLCLKAGMLDAVEAAIMPVMLGKGTRMLEEASLMPHGGFKLEMVESRHLDASGIVMCKYNTVLIVGGTGKVGRQITKLLANTDTPTYQSSRSGASTTEPGAENVKPIAFDWADEKTWAAALKSGATSVFLVAPPVLDMLPPMQSFIDQARLKGTAKRFILLSGSPMEADINGPAMSRPHAYLKELGDRGEVEWAALRPTWFQQNFAEQLNHINSIKDESTVYSATADGKIPWIATEDIAACAFQLLLQDDAPNDEYLLLGSELLSYDDIAEILTEVLGRKIIHKNLSRKGLEDRYVNYGLPQDYAEMMGAMDTNIKNGSENRTNSVVLAVTGKQPRKFRDVAKELRNVWATES